MQLQDVEKLIQTGESETVEFKRSTGFNFYYGAIKGTAYKWLNLMKVFESILDPKHDIISMKYFTAKVSGKLDPGQSIRQKTGSSLF